MSLPVMHPHQKADPPHEADPLLRRQTPLREQIPSTPQAEWLHSNAGGTHPTGMLACSLVCFTCSMIFSRFRLFV